MEDGYPASPALDGVILQHFLLILSEDPSSTELQVGKEATISLKHHYQLIPPPCLVLPHFRFLKLYTSNVFLAPHSLSVSWDSEGINVRPVVVPWVPEILIILFQFSLLFRLENVY